MKIDTDAELSQFNVIAVTGASGFVGRHLVRHLESIGKTVRKIDRFPADAVGGGDGYVQADLRRPEDVPHALEGADLVFHLAGNANGTISVADPEFDFETNTVATFRVAKTCADLGSRLVFMSSACVYGWPQRSPMAEDHPTQPFLPYGASKLAAETLVTTMTAAFGLQAAVARSFVIYGPGEDPRYAGGEVSQFLRWHLNDLPIKVVGDIDLKTRDFVHVSDVVRALAVVADRADAGEVVNVGSGRETTMRQLADVVSSATGRVALLDADPTILDDSFRLVADVTRLRTLGHRQLTSLPEGVASLARDLGAFPELPGTTAAFRNDPLSSVEV